MPIEVFGRKGTHPRVLTMIGRAKAPQPRGLGWPLDYALRLDVEEIGQAFAEAARVGLYGQAQDAVLHGGWFEAQAERRFAGELRLGAVHGGLLRDLMQAAKTTCASLEARESGVASDEAIPADRIARLARPTCRFPVRLPRGREHKLLGIVVELSPGGEEVFSERVSAVLRAWARLVEIGAFAGDNGVHSWAQPPRVQLGLEDEIELTLEDAHVPADAYAPLLVALDEIDRAGQAIGRLEAGP